MKMAIIDDKSPVFNKLDLLLAGVFAEDDDKNSKEKEPLKAPKELAHFDKTLLAELMAAASLEGFTGAAGQVFILRTLKKEGPRMIGLIGYGKKSDLAVNSYRKAGGVAFKTANDKRVKRLGLCTPHSGKIASEDTLSATFEGFELAKYRFAKYFTENKPEFHVEDFSVVSSDSKAKDAKEALHRATATVFGVNLARDLVNEIPMIMNPQELAAIALREGKSLGLDVEIFDEKALAKENMRLVLAVGKAAVKVAPPRLIRIAYRPKKKGKKHIALVGKGVTFDSGGLDLKPADGMRDMKIDMAGAAAVLGTLLAVAKLKPDVAVTGYMVCVENGIGSNAYHPGDVVKSRKGLTVEIDNTDAEGRLILADALDYAQTRDKLDTLIDVATLTGAVMVALGANTAGLFSTSDKLAEDLFESGKKSGEDFWRLPLNEELRENLKSNIADMKNSGSRLGGAITGAVFLKKFVSDKLDWAHLDIAGPAFNEKEHPYIPKGGAGFAVRTLVDYICRL